MQKAMLENKDARFPRLDTILMVESFIMDHDGEMKKSGIWKSLPKGVMYPTFCIIMDYLLFSRKISIDAEGKIGWVHYPKSAHTRIMNKKLFLKQF